MKSHLFQTSDDGWRLQLSNAMAWRIEACDGARPWLEKFASTLELAVDGPDHLPWLIFFHSKGRNRQNPLLIESTADIPVTNLPKDGWRVHQSLFLRFWEHDRCPDVLCELLEVQDRQHKTIQLYHALTPVHFQVVKAGGGPFHSALIERGGAGVILVGRSNMGKSTCARRIPEPWHALSDDDTLVVRVSAGQYEAHPFPTWSEFFHDPDSTRTWNVQRHVPLAGIFFLNQAAEDGVVRFGQGVAALFLTELLIKAGRPAFFDLSAQEMRELRRRCFVNMSELAKHVPTFLLSVSLEGRFWECIEQALADSHSPFIPPRMSDW